MAKQSETPQPVPVNVVCSLCDEPWHLHKQKNGEVTTLECIRLLKEKAERATVVVKYPYYPPYPTPRPWGPYPLVTWGVQSGTSTAEGRDYNTYTAQTPKVLTAAASTNG